MRCGNLDGDACIFVVEEVVVVIEGRDSTGLVLPPLRSYLPEVSIVVVGLLDSNKVPKSLTAFDLLKSSVTPLAFVVPIRSIILLSVIADSGLARAIRVGLEEVTTGAFRGDDINEGVGTYLRVEVEAVGVVGPSSSSSSSTSIISSVITNPTSSGSSCTRSLTSGLATECLLFPGVFLGCPGTIWRPGVCGGLRFEGIGVVCLECARSTSFGGVIGRGG